MLITKLLDWAPTLSLYDKKQRRRIDITDAKGESTLIILTLAAKNI